MSLHERGPVTAGQHFKILQQRTRFGVEETETNMPGSKQHIVPTAEIQTAHRPLRKSSPSCLTGVKDPRRVVSTVCADAREAALDVSLESFENLNKHVTIGQQKTGKTISAVVGVRHYENIAHGFMQRHRRWGTRRADIEQPKERPLDQVIIPGLALA